ncbi:MAG: 4Fe-4S dicluster domain-containing protein [Candidatus Omnitrophota bacterium]|nr:MAG: 4Fe-4S dicluster domain-containing protein [Candidatus Omnitrophota bacterium]
MFGPLIAKPGSSKDNKTGSWRSVKKPNFLCKDCIGCGLCKLICPEGCIEGKEKNTYRTDYLYCKGCGLCAYICPKKDIEMTKEREE